MHSLQNISVSFLLGCVAFSSSVSPQCVLDQSTGSLLCSYHSSQLSYHKLATTLVEIWCQVLTHARMELRTAITPLVAERVGSARQPTSAYIPTTGYQPPTPVEDALIVVLWIRTVLNSASTMRTWTCVLRIAPRATCAAANMMNALAGMVYYVEMCWTYSY